MHGPEQVLVHVPHITAAGGDGKCCFRAVRSPSNAIQRNRQFTTSAA